MHLHARIRVARFVCHSCRPGVKCGDQIETYFGSMRCLLPGPAGGSNTLSEPHLALLGANANIVAISQILSQVRPYNCHSQATSLLCLRDDCFSYSCDGGPRSFEGACETHVILTAGACGRGSRQHFMTPLLARPLLVGSGRMCPSGAKYVSIKSSFCFIRC